MRIDSRFRSVWLRENPVLASGIIGLDRADKRMKLGDGTTHWVDLPYMSAQVIPSNAVPANSPYVTKDELTALIGSGGGSSSGGGGTGDVTTAQLNAAVNLLQDKATAATDQELAAAIATVNTALSGKQSSATAATDSELASAISTINTALSTKQDASLAATDAEVAVAVATLNTALTGKADLATEQADKAALQALISANTTAIAAKQDASTAATDSELSAAILAARSALWAPNTPVKAGQLVVNTGQVYQANTDFTTPAVFDAVNLTALNPGLAIAPVAITADVAITTNGTWQVIAGLQQTPPVNARPQIVTLSGLAVSHSVAQGSASFHLGIYDVTSGAAVAARTIDYPTAGRWAAVPTVHLLIPAGAASHTYQAAIFAGTAGTFTARTTTGLGWLMFTDQK